MCELLRYVRISRIEHAMIGAGLRTCEIYEIPGLQSAIEIGIERSQLIPENLLLGQITR